MVVGTQYADLRTLNSRQREKVRSYLRGRLDRNLSSIGGDIYMCWDRNKDDAASTFYGTLHEIAERYGVSVPVDILK